jgi:hypothetical protein
MKPLTSLAPLLVLSLTSGALAQPPATDTQMRIRGTVQAFQGQVLRVLTETDGAIEFAVPATIGINGVARRSAADIAAGGFIGTTAAKGADGRWHATEVHIFPEEMRGAGEGHYPWDFPETTMTNATVTGAASAGNGRELRLTHADGEVDVVVGPQTAIVALVPGDTSLLVPGATVFVLGLAGNGTFSPIALVAETDGVKPPM